jgi:hypothetical protein
MRKLYWALIVVLIVTVTILFILFTASVGPGTGFHFSVVEGCDIAEKYFSSYETEGVYTIPYRINMSDELLDGVIIEWGFPRNGLKKTTLREFCLQRYKRTCDNNMPDLVYVGGRCNVS